MAEPMSGSAGAMSKAAGRVPGGRVKTKINTGSVGNETRADVAGAQEGGSMAEARGSSLRAAVGELHTQHPIPYSDHGPHHGTDHHVRHEPVRGVYGKRGR